MCGERLLVQRSIWMSATRAISRTRTIYNSRMICRRSVRTAVFFGNLDTLLEWHIADPVDAAERVRNDLVHSDYQQNRNPFVDHPEWVVAIYGSPGSEPCVLSLPTIDGESLRFVLKLSVPGRYRLLRSTDLVNWTSVEEFEASSGNPPIEAAAFWFHMLLSSSTTPGRRLDGR